MTAHRPRCVRDTEETAVSDDLRARVATLADMWERTTVRARPAFLVAADELREALAETEAARPAAPSECWARGVDGEGNPNCSFGDHDGPHSDEPVAFDGSGRDAGGVEFIKRLVGAWDCCGTCAGGALAAHDAEVRHAERKRALLEAANRWTQGAWSDVMLPKPTPPAVPVIAYANRFGDWLRAAAEDAALADLTRGGDDRG